MPEKSFIILNISDDLLIQIRPWGRQTNSNQSPFSPKRQTHCVGTPRPIGKINGSIKLLG
jgi:hypothetical protein